MVADFQVSSPGGPAPYGGFHDQLPSCYPHLSTWVLLSANTCFIQSWLPLPCQHHSSIQSHPFLVQIWYKFYYKEIRHRFSDLYCVGAVSYYPVCQISKLYRARWKVYSTYCQTFLVFGFVWISRLGKIYKACNTLQVTKYCTNNQGSCH